MNLINKQVTHKSFGKGKIINQTDSSVEINYPSGNKQFIFPDAFGTYLKLVDQNAADSVDKILQEREKERNQAEQEIENEKALQYKLQQSHLQREKILKNLKIHPSSQAAFWCEEEDKERVFTEWSIFTGVTKSGANEGQPNRPIRLHQNSACLLTERDQNMPEQDRFILGVYMVNETFIGRMCEDGYIPAHSEYRLRLSEEESKKILFWNYYINEKYPNNMTWNTGKYRYFENIWMAQILKDIVAMKKEPKEREFAQRFLEYFCQMNQIVERELPKPDGVLMRKE